MERGWVPACRIRWDYGDPQRVAADGEDAGHVWPGPPVHVRNVVKELRRHARILRPGARLPDGVASHDSKCAVGIEGVEHRRARANRASVGQVFAIAHERDQCPAPNHALRGAAWGCERNGLSVCGGAPACAAGQTQGDDCQAIDAQVSSPSRVAWRTYRRSAAGARGSAQPDRQAPPLHASWAALEPRSQASPCVPPIRVLH
jgi:hypothetical protein